MQRRSSLPPPSTRSWRRLRGGKATGSCPWRTPRPVAWARPWTGSRSTRSTSRPRCTCRSTTTLRPRSPLKEMRVIFAHPQTHEQCSDKIEEWGIPVIHTSSNAASAHEAKKTPNAGAILSAGRSSALPSAGHRPDHREQCVRTPPGSSGSAKTPSEDPRREKCSILIDPHAGPVRAALRPARGVCKAQHQPDPYRVPAIQTRGSGNTSSSSTMRGRPQPPEVLRELKGDHDRQGTRLLPED